MNPVGEAFERLWPDAMLMNLLDDSLPADLATEGRQNDAMTARFEQLARYAVRAGAQGVLFTCSAFGQSIEAAARAVDVPVYKPNEAMFLEALELVRTTPGTGRIGLLCTFAPSIPSMREELLSMARRADARVELVSACASGAMEALAAGDAATHDRLIAEQSLALRECDVVMLGQFSMARARQAVAGLLNKPVLTSPDSAVRLLRRTLLGA